MAENKNQPTQQPKHSQIWKNILGGESSVDILEAYNLTQRNVRENSPPNHQICDTEFVGLGGCWGIWVNTLSSSIIKYNLSKIWEIVSSFLKSTLSFYWKVHRKNTFFFFDSKQKKKTCCKWKRLHGLYGKRRLQAAFRSPWAITPCNQPPTPFQGPSPPRRCPWCKLHKWHWFGSLVVFSYHPGTWHSFIAELNGGSLVWLVKKKKPHKGEVYNIQVCVCVDEFKGMPEVPRIFSGLFPNFAPSGCTCSESCIQTLDFPCKDLESSRLKQPFINWCFRFQKSKWRRLRELQKQASLLWSALAIDNVNSPGAGVFSARSPLVKIMTNF